MLVDLEVPEYKRTDEWWKNLIKFFVKDYNRPLLSNNVDANGVALTQNIEDQLNWDYYYSNCDVGSMYYLVQGTVSDLNKNNNIIFRLCNSLEGKMSEFMDNFTVEVELLSENAKSLKDTFKKQLMYMVENKDYFNQLRELGIVFGGVPEGIETPEDVEEYMETTYRDFGAITAERIAEELIKTNNYAILKVKEFLNLLVCGRTGTDRVVKNGKVVEEFVMPQELGLDLRMSNDNNFNDSARFRYRFKQYVSPSQILEDYGDELAKQDGAVDAIKALSETSNNKYYPAFTDGNPASPTGDFYNFYSVDTLSSNRPIASMSVVKMYVLLRFDTRERVNSKGLVVNITDVGKDGNVVEENANQEGIATNYRVATATMIGGRYIVNKKWVENAIYETYPMTVQQFPLTVYLDNYNNGVYRSRVSRMRGYQNTIIKADTRIDQAQDRDGGVNYLIKYLGASSEDKKGQSPAERINDDFKAMGYSMSEVDVDDPSGGLRQMVETIDFTKSLSVVQAYQQIKMFAINECEVMMHLPEISQGIQSRTVGKAEQQTTIASATQGLLPLLNGFIHYIQKCIQLSSNIQKYVYVADNANEDYARMILGDREYEWLKTSVYEHFEMFGIYINPYNVIDDKKRQQLDAKLAMYAQGGTIDPLCDLELMQIRNYREALIFLRRYFKKKEKEAMAMAQQQRMDNLQIAQAQNEAIIQGKQIPAQAQVETAHIKTQGTNEDNMRTTDTKKQVASLEADVKVLTKQMEGMQKEKAKP